MIMVLLGGIVLALLLGRVLVNLGLYASNHAIGPLVLRTWGLYAWGITIIAMIMAIIMILRQDEFAIIVIIASNLYIDWYLGLGAISEILAVVLLLIFFFARSPQFPWERPRILWVWVLFLVITFFPTLRSLNFFDGAFYYCTIILGALVMFWIGTVIARDSASVRKLFIFLSLFGTLVAIHTIIEITTGVFLLKTSHYDAQLALESNFELSAGYYRAESFLRTPDSNGGFLAIMLLIPLGLFTESTLVWEKILYLAEMCLMLLALLFTYSTGGWVGALVGICAFIVLVRHTLYSILIPLFIFLIAGVFIFAFPTQVALQIQHAIVPHDLQLRIAVWQSGINVIRAFPFTGIGIGRDVYFVRADPYRVSGQYVPTIHPHNSFLEFAALGGIPVLIVFIALLSFALWRAFRNLSLSDGRTRSLLAGGLAAVIGLSFYSLANAGWTLVPLDAIGWLILGVISSPLLISSRTKK